MIGGPPAAEVDVDEALVRRLLVEQHPDLADDQLRPVASGWDNVLFRLGEHRTVRLPRRALAAPLVEHEQRWLPVLAPRLPLPVPVPERIGRPAAGYPWHWSIGPWFEGRPAAEEPPADPGAAAETLGRFLAAMHRPAPADAPENPYRGVPLAERDATLRERLPALDRLLDREVVVRSWEDALVADPWPGPALWLHGDVHPFNLVVQDGALAAVVDFGDLTAGDPASDLAGGWMLLPPAEHRRFRAAAGAVDDATWERARGWTLFYGVMFLLHGADDHRYAGVGRRALVAAAGPQALRG